MHEDFIRCMLVLFGAPRVIKLEIWHISTNEFHHWSYFRRYFRPVLLVCIFI